jgi:hypothetical protein
MADIRTLLNRLGMLEYTDRFIVEGFDTWEVVMDIRETDLTFLGVSPVHRKRLQQEISEARAHSIRERSSSPLHKTHCRYASLNPICLPNVMVRSRA